MAREYDMNQSADKGFGGKKVSGTFAKPKEELTDDSIMPFGKYKKTNTPMSKVPGSYLLWAWEHEQGPKYYKRPNDPLHRYIAKNWRNITDQARDYIPENLPDRI